MFAAHAMSKKILSVILVVGLAPLASAAVYNLNWFTIDCGGAAESTGGAFTLAGTIGQPDAGPPAGPMTGGGFELAGGFWFAAPAAPPTCDGDANGDGTVDPLDTGYVLSRFGCAVGTGDAACNAADQNSDGVVDPLDVGYVLARFGTCE